MEQEKIYYIVIDEKSTGPFTLDEITLNPALSPETLVWKPGLDNWVAAKTLQELAPAFSASFRQNNTYQQTPPDFNNPNYQGGDNYGNETRQENYQNNRFADNPQYSTHHTYRNQHQQRRYNPYDDRYKNDYRPAFRTNWLPWAIVATVFGFFTSCIGAIFGIIGIVQANKANTLYAQGYDVEADAANSNAKIMTIIGLILAGIGIIVAFWFGSIFTGLSNASYL